MAYCTPEDVEILTGEPLDDEQEDYLNFWLDVIEVLIDNLIEKYGKDPASVTLTRKKMVSQLMGQVAMQQYQVNGYVVSYSEGSGDTQESETTIGGSIYRRISLVEPMYLDILGLKRLQLVSARITAHGR